MKFRRLNESKSGTFCWGWVFIEVQYPTPRNLTNGYLKNDGPWKMYLPAFKYGVMFGSTCEISVGVTHLKNVHDFLRFMVNLDLIHTSALCFFPHKYLESVNVLCVVRLLHPQNRSCPINTSVICTYNIQINVPTSTATYPNVGYCI